MGVERGKRKGSQAGEMRLIVLRHGETDWNVEKRIQGQKTVSLNLNGRRQIHQACKQLADMKVDYAVTSPLLRAYESAQICVRELGIPLMVHPAFAERSFGELEGKTSHEISRAFGIADVEEIHDARFGIESLRSLGDRVEQGLRELACQFPDQTILLVTHGSIIKYMGEKRGLDLGIVDNGTYLEMQEEAVLCSEAW